MSSESTTASAPHEATTEIVDTGAKHRLDETTAAKVRGMGLGMGVAGLVLIGLGLAAGGDTFPSSYLVGFGWATTIALGGLFFPMIWRLTKAGWPVAARRHMEWLAGFLPLVAILFIPVVLKSHDLYHHWMDGQTKTDPILIKKAAWLDPTMFYVRAYIYIAIWIGLAFLFRRLSFKQDETGDKSLTLRAQWWSAPLMPLFALSVSFAGFDWVMSLDPHWYSTIFGIYIFAGGAVSSLAAVGLITVMLRSKGLMGKIVTVEHQHDVGKLFFGFIVFWAYIAFSQFILIWYANIPEETIYFRHRWEHGWAPWSLLLLFGHFFVPFLFMLSRWAKRINSLMVTGCVLMLVMHFVDWYWLVKPNFAEGHFHFSIWDIVGWAGPALVLAGTVLFQVAKGPLYPLRDPRIRESMKMDNI